jgi:UDP-N-acetylglucosamine--N-acetylmuramyl-(pentapeptide) pyrophosphoryl-undecaprenol N-acetylglucosamine transferase
MSDLRVLFAGGGTGGHLFPGIEVAREIGRAVPGARFLFVGTGRPAEARALEGTGFDRETLPSAPLPRAISGLPRFVGGAARALRAGVRRVRAFAPHIVVGLGGYASAAPAAAAALLRRPLYLLEQNAVPGRANRLLARFAREVFVPWESARRRFPRRARVTATGNPVRRAVLEAVPDARARLGLDPALRALLVIGGSQGARGLNRAVEASLDAFARERARLQILHLAGDEDAPRLGAAYRERGIRAYVAAYCAEMQVAYSAADLAIARAGGSTIAELACRGLPAVLVPFPAAAEDHQTENAREVERSGGALLVSEGRLAGEGIERALALLFDDARRRDMAARMAAGGRPEAARTIARRMLQSIGIG